MVWTINLADGCGFTYSDMVRIDEIVEIGDTYNLVTDMGDMWMEKNKCYMTENYIEYQGEWFVAEFRRIEC